MAKIRHGHTTVELALKLVDTHKRHVAIENLKKQDQEIKLTRWGRALYRSLDVAEDSLDCLQAQPQPQEQQECPSNSSEREAKLVVQNTFYKVVDPEANAPGLSRNLTAPAASSTHVDPQEQDTESCASFESCKDLDEDDDHDQQDQQEC